MINRITGYETSKNCEQLAQLARKTAVICLVPCGEEGPDSFHVANTYFDGKGFSIGAAWGTYVYSSSEAEFIEECEKQGISFIEPGLVK